MRRLTVVLQIWTLLLVACAAVVTFVFVQVDIPLALHFWKDSHFLSPLTQAFGAAIILATESAVILAMVFVRLVRGQVPAFGESLAIACLSSICAYGINDHVLKLFFGVPVPKDVLHGARHALHLYAGSEGSSFPSGHMVLAAAFAGVFMRLYRVSIWPFAALLLLGAALLVAGDWHFLSDIIAGTFFGTSAGLLAGEGWAAHIERRLLR